jgi:hypothetical protein
LLALIAPIIALLFVFWLLLPGGVASMSYSPSQLSQAVQVQPQEWQGRSVSVRGYLARGCGAREAVSGCTLWLLLDQPAAHALSAREAQTLDALQVTPQHESSMHAFLRRVIPGLALPFPRGIQVGRQVTITGTPRATTSAAGVPVFTPKSL